MKVNTKGWAQSNHIVLAVSTGVDSMVLLHQLITKLADSYHKLTCLHVNHNVRPVAAEEEQFLKAYCEHHQIPLHTHHLDLSAVIEKGNSIENEARIERYQWFDQMMSKLKADVLLTAHHQNDQIETIFYRLMTGRSTRSSLGMSYLTSRQQYQLCKPLLDVTKEEIRNYQTAHKVPYYEDESNAENHYVRNDIRNRILPDIEANQHLSTEHLLKLKDWHDEQLKVVKVDAMQFNTEFVDFYNDGQEIAIPRNKFLSLRHSVKMAVLDEIFTDLSLDKSIPEKTYNEWFRQLAENVTQCILYASHEWIIHIAYDKFIIMANYEKKLAPIKIDQLGIYNYGRYSIEITNEFPTFEYPLVIRTRNDGDKFELNGKKGHKKISRLLIDEKVIQLERNQMPILVNAYNEIIAVGTLYLKNKYKQSIFIRNLGEE
ncbi:tRNA lysidine(34) synthetase TilS [Staphylococcus aureus]